MNYLKHSIFILLAAIIVACTEAPIETDKHDHGSETQAEHLEKVSLNSEQVSALQMTLTELKKETLSGYVEASGNLEVPPQNEAVVTAIVGANVQRIFVIEGDEIKEGQLLAYLTHPNLIALQTEYITAKSALDFLKNDLERQETLVKEKVGSGKQLQQAKANYVAKKGETKGLEYQLKILGLNPASIAKGEITERVPVTAPIDGFIQKVNIKTAQFVAPETSMFEIINVHHVHADLMVFEKDIAKVHEGQQVKFTTEAAPGEVLDATIISVGKSFEENPKAVHIHAEIENKEGFLLPGMYIQGKIIVNENSTHVLPIDAVVNAGDKFYAFSFLGDENGNWTFSPQEVFITAEDEKYVAIKFILKQNEKQKYAKNNAYYLLAEWKKGEAEHSH